MNNETKDIPFYKLRDIINSVEALDESQRIQAHRALNTMQGELNQLREISGRMAGWLWLMKCDCKERSVCARCMALANYGDLEGEE